MAIEPDIRDQAYEFFVEEAPELLQIIESGLLNLWEESSAPKIHELMRAAHSIKGGAASVGLDAIKTLSHRLEDIFKALYNDSTAIDAEFETQLLQAFDCLRQPLMEQIETDRFNPEQAVDTAEPIFAQIEDRLGDALKQAENVVASSADFGIDIAVSIFEVDVKSGLQRLTDVIASPNDYEVAGEVRAQAEVFAGFAELLELHGFGEIASLAIEAVEAHPDRALAIAQLVLADFQAGRTAVLNGDRERGGEPSAELRAIANGTETLPSSLDCVEVNEAGSPLEASVEPLSEFSMQGPEGASDGEDPERFHATAEYIDRLAAEAEGIEALANIFARDAELDEVEDSQAAALLPEDNWANEASPEDMSVEDMFGDVVTALGLDSDTSSTGEAENARAGEADPSEEEIFDAWREALSAARAEGAADAEIEAIAPINSPAIGDAEPQSVEPILGTNELTVAEADSFLAELETPPEADSTDKIEAVLFADDPSADDPSADDPSADEVFGGWTAAIDSSQPEAVLPESEPVTSEPEPPLATPFPEPVSANPMATLAAALQSVRENFDTLPPASDLDAGGIAVAPSAATPDAADSSTPAAPPAQQSDRPAEAPSPTKRSSGLSVRVDLERLQRMDNQVGELAINRNGLSLQNDQLQGTVRDLLARFANFQTLAAYLRDISDRMLIAPDRYRSNGALPSFALPPRASNLRPSSFDSLELDSYSELHAIVQEMLEETIQIEESAGDIALFASQSNQLLEQNRQVLGQLRDELMWSRMLPLSEILNRFPRVLRDLSVKHGKSVGLKLSGAGVLVDKAMLEKLYDPMLHLLRNAFDHGIEPPEQRRQRGKAEKGYIEVRAYYKGSQTIVEVADDGRGIDFERVRQQAIDLSLLSIEQSEAISTDRLLDFLFEPGFSTAERVSDLSGRGMGLDVVRSQLRSLKGTVTVTSERERGTTFTLKLPLTLSISKLLICRAGAAALALPSDSVDDIVNPLEGTVKQSGQRRFLYWQGQTIPIYRLADLLDYRCPLADTPASRALMAVPAPQDWASPILILRRDRQTIAIEVDQLLSEQELAIKPFGTTLTPPRYAYGCTILGDGSLVPVLDGLTLWDEVERGSSGRSTSSGAIVSHTPTLPAKSINAVQMPRILVVDDSSTQRRTLAASFQRAGYRVLQARNGREALQHLEQHADVQLIVCDIEMPNMNGFEFLTHRRQIPALAAIPTVMLTSRSGDKHKRLAQHLGADGYFTKPYLEQEFLAAAARLCGGAATSSTAASSSPALTV